MDVTLALQRAVRGFRLGTAALAAHLGISETSLNHKVSPTYPNAHCSPEEMLAIMEATEDDGPLEAMALRRDKVLMPAPRAAAGHQATEALVASVREFGEFASEAAQGLADGRITGNEHARLQREAAEAIAAIHALMRIASSMRGDGAAALRAVPGGNAAGSGHEAA